LAEKIRSRGTGVTIYETESYQAGSERVMELWMVSVAKKKQKKTTREAQRALSQTRLTDRSRELIPETERSWIVSG